MRTWEHFAMEVPRLDEAYVFDPSQRTLLEETVAGQVSLLLSLYGEISDFEIDVSYCPDIEDPITYQVLELAEEVLDDDSELVISQITFSDDTPDTRPGVYVLTHQSDEEEVLRSIIVHDPSQDIVPPVYYRNGRKLEYEVLQELHEVLGILTNSYIQYSSPNDPPYNTSLFPMVVTDSEFESIVAQLGDDFPQ